MGQALGQLHLKAEEPEAKKKKSAGHVSGKFQDWHLAPGPSP